MELNIEGSTLTITDNIKSVEHFQEIKSALDKMKISNSSIHIKISNSLSITSSVIGYLMKLIHKDEIRLSMSVGDDRLVALLNDLGLSSEFNVSKV
jgi:hypothetical protein